MRTQRNLVATLNFREVKVSPFYHNQLISFPIPPPNSLFSFLTTFFSKLLLYPPVRIKTLLPLYIFCLLTGALLVYVNLIGC